jgi:hypothetical protein
MKKLALLGCLLLLAAVPALAFPNAVCPSGAYWEAYSPTNCNVQITANPNGTLTLNVVDTHPYDNAIAAYGDDMVVGFWNDTAYAINAISLSGTAVANGGIFGYDGDDANYDPSYISTTNIGYDAYGDAVSGQINFAGGVAPGGTAWFNLEETPSGGTFQGYVGPVTPEPGSFLLLGTGMLGLLGLMFRKVIA